MMKNFTNSVNKVEQILQSLLNTVNSIIDDKRYFKMSCMKLSRDLMWSEKNSLRQTYLNEPGIPALVLEDQKPNALKLQRRRPFSAKYIKKELNNSMMKKNKRQRRSNNSEYFSSTQFHSIYKEKDRPMTGITRFHPISHIQEQQSQNEDQNMVQKLRFDLIKKKQKQNQLKIFEKTIENDQKSYKDLQKKFQKKLGQKKLTFSDNGILVQLQTKKTNIKKMGVNKLIFKNTNKQRQNKFVKFSQKQNVTLQNYFKKAEDIKSPIKQVKSYIDTKCLFYTSEHSNYTIL